MVKNKEIITQFVLPPIEMTANYPGFSSGLAHDPDIRNEVEIWCKENLKPKNGKAPSPKIGLEYMSYIYPLAKYKDTFILLTKFLTFLFAYDDEETVSDVEGFNKSFDHVLQIFEGKEVGKTQTEKLMSYFGNELRLRLSPTTMSRMAMGMQEWIKSMKQELDLTIKGNDMDINECLRFREDNGGTLIIVTLGEALVNLDSSPFIKEDYIAPVYHAAANHLALVNDIYSFRKEYYDKEVKANALYVLSKNHSLSFQGAVDKCCDLIKQYENEFVTECHKALEICDSNVKDSLSLYFEILSNMMCGNIHYSQLSSRYHGKANKQRINHGSITMDPHQTLFTPN